MALVKTSADFLAYSRTKERQIEHIYTSVDAQAAARGRCCGARLAVMLANAFLAAAACAGLVFAILILTSEFGMGDIRTSATVLAAACAALIVVAFIGFVGAAIRSRLWLLPLRLRAFGVPTCPRGPRHHE